MCAFVRLNSSHPFLSSNTCPAWFQAKGSRSSSDKSLYTNEFWILPYELETYPVLHSTRIKIIDLICFADVTILIVFEEIVAYNESVKFRQRVFNVEHLLI